MLLYIHVVYNLRHVANIIDIQWSRPVGGRGATPP